MAPEPPQRVARITVPPQPPALPRPDDAQPKNVRDAFRECTFALAPEIAWLHEALTLQHGIVGASVGRPYRNHRYAAALLLWSRLYVAEVELLRATAWAAYAVCPPLIRSSLEWLAAEQAVVGEEFHEFEAWLAGALAMEREHTALDVGMGQYMAGQEIAMSPDLGPVYRAAAELARPHFGASLVQGAPESNRERIAINWADQAFHFGWAQLLFGWQMLLHDRQLRFAIGRDLFAVEADQRERYHRLAREAETLLAQRDRCRIEWITAPNGAHRLLIHNFRRRPGGAPKRLLL